MNCGCNEDVAIDDIFYSESILSLYYCSCWTRTLECFTGLVLSSLAVIDSKTASRSLIAVISQRAAAILTAPMTPRPSSADSHVRAHTCTRSRWLQSGPIVALVCWVRERWKSRRAHPAGKRQRFLQRWLITSGCGCQAWFHWLSDWGPVGPD